jgi:O-methyltransferase
MNPYLKRAGMRLYHRLSDVPAVQKRGHRLYWSARYRRWCRENPCPEFPDREMLYESLVQTESLDAAVDYLEFGVWQGAILRWWLGRNQDPRSTFVGFDSFEGLPEDWDGMPRGAFSTGGKVPDIPDPRFQPVKGYFKDTLPGWLRGREFPRKLVVHMDADLYSSTLLVLVHLLPWLKTGDVLIFDEFHSLLHEFRAFCDAVSACPRAFRAVARTGQHAQVALSVV